AGFDLTSLHVGGFGAFGAIAQCHVRLRARPRADTTWTATGSRNDLLRLARALIAARIEAAAVELFSPDLAGSAAWTLAVRLAAGDAAVAASGAALQVLSGGWRELLPERQMLLWNSTARLLATPPVTLRLGALPTDLPSVLDELEPVVGPGLISVGALGHIRWAGDTGMMELRRLRARLAPRGVPVVLERGPWRVRAGAGHFGACRPGVAALTQRLRAAFDPDELFVTPLEERDDP
ncbi:MAG TPA: hypothetical protein VHW65_11380, partial [Gemmatimonadales bacterium]|nr:hypothetical protein [Gemmatimonadales bacterium]